MCVALQEILHQFGGHSAFGSGVSTGWKGMDVYYKPVPGELTVVTGTAQCSNQLLPDLK